MEAPYCFPLLTLSVMSELPSRATASRGGAGARAEGEVRGGERGGRQHHLHPGEDRGRRVQGMTHSK